MFAMVKHLRETRGAPTQYTDPRCDVAPQNRT
jgi:hypothetical protein